MTRLRDLMSCPFRQLLATDFDSDLDVESMEGVHSAPMFIRPSAISLLQNDRVSSEHPEGQSHFSLHLPLQSQGHEWVLSLQTSKF